MPCPLVLLVDPDRDSRAVFSAILSFSGYSCIEAIGGDAAMDVIRAQPPDVVISEHRVLMRDGSSFTAALRAHSETSRIPVLVVTARATAAEIAEALADGPTRVVTKPITPRELVAIVQQVVVPVLIQRDGGSA
jgi:CheY-like chemotaxis protein